MNATQIAAVYGLPPDRVGGKRGDSLTYSTVQQGALQIIEALRPWLVRLETAFFSIMPQNRVVRFNSDALLKTDLAERANIYRTWRDIGFQSIDEMRETEDLPPLPDEIGADNIPLDAIVAMARSTRAIPNSLLPQVTLEQRLLVEYLQELGMNVEPTGLPADKGAPAGPGAQNAPPVINVPGGAGADVGGYQPPNVLNEIVKEITSVRGGNYGLDPRVLAQIVAAVRQAERDEANGPEFIGPWLPGREFNSNGNGHRH
jgi:hypothetical protein